MSDMNHCSFEDAYNALQECAKHIMDGAKTSPQEMKYVKELYEACNDFLFEVDYVGITDEDGNIVRI